MNRSLALCLFCCALNLFSCSDDTQNRVKPGSTTFTPGTTSGGKLATGDACSKSSECVTTYCVRGVCDFRAGEGCGQTHCASGEGCDQGTEACRPKAACPAAKVCGSSCCGDSQDCVGGACVEACEDGRAQCGAVGRAPVCCVMGQGCVFNQCVPLGAACTERKECERGQYCEPTLGRCVDQTNQGTCSYVPPSEVFKPKVLWHWNSSPVSPEFDQVMASPIVANLTDDNGDGVINQDDIPDVIFATFSSSGDYNGLGVLRVVSGDTGKEHWSSTGLPAPYYIRGSVTPAVADIDSDGLPDIVVSAYIGGDTMMNSLVALTHTGEKKWEVPGASISFGGVSIGNVDGKGDPEIMAYGQLLNSKGQPICTGLPATLHPALADVDDDGIQEIVLGARVWKVVDATKIDGTGCAPVESTQAASGGLNAIADLDGDGKPEVVVVAAPKIFVYEADGTLKWEQVIPVDKPRHISLFGTSCDDVPVACLPDNTCADGRFICSGGSCVSYYCGSGGGPPTIADFDGDGKPDIAVATRWYYLVYSAQGDILWAHKTTDFSSAVTGSSVFDFEGDGKAEVVYNDEQFLRVYRGAGSGTDTDGDGFKDPVILLEIPNTSGTLTEYPLIVDVNNDAKAEIVLMANDYSSGDNPEKTKGIFVFGDELNNWVPTRRIWNQHAYHVTNINEDASVPLVAVQNWKQPFLNNYRQNTQGETMFNAPDLSAQVASGCELGQVSLNVTLENKGSLGVRAGAIKAAVYLAVDGGPDTFVRTLVNSQPLPPGGISVEALDWSAPQRDLGKTLRWKVLVDEDEAGAKGYNECDETNNTALAEVVCIIAS